MEGWEGLPPWVDDFNECEWWAAHGYPVTPWGLPHMPLYWRVRGQMLREAQTYAKG